MQPLHDSAPAQASAAQSKPAPAAANAPVAYGRRVPAHAATPPDPRSLRPTLPPEGFTGKTRQAYAAARVFPQLMAQLPCYCYCDASFGHASLHTCYETDHSSHCATCQDEAILAAYLKQTGLTDVQIRDHIVARYASKP